MDFPRPPDWVVHGLQQGMAIPAHPLALTGDGAFDPLSQRALTRYYAAAGAGGVAVGVHTTQFAIRDRRFGLLRLVLQCAAGALEEIERGGGRPLVRIAGICGRTAQAVEEAALAGSLGYHVGLVSLAALGKASDDDLIRHCQAVAERIPLMGFYLQPAVGGRPLGAEFWRRLADIPNVVAVKIAPFDRYRTLEVIHGVARSGRAGEVALYTGNDDTIVTDLLTRFDVSAGGRVHPLRVVGGLLGHWAVWTSKAVELHRTLRGLAVAEAAAPADVLALAGQVTDCNAALFDAAHGFAGCIAGIQYVLHRQGLLASMRCLDPRETLSPGQAEQIQRVRRDYPNLIDDDFVARGLRDWLD